MLELGHAPDRNGGILRVVMREEFSKGLFTKRWAGCEDTTRGRVASGTRSCKTVPTPQAQTREQLLLEPGDRSGQAEGSQTSAMTFDGRTQP